MATFSAGELSRARVARRLVALLLILAGVLACGLNLAKVGGSLTDVRLVVTTVFRRLAPGGPAAGSLRRARAAHVWLLAVGVGVSVTLLIGQIMVSTHTWVPSQALYLLTLACIPFLLRHAVVAQ